MASWNEIDPKIKFVIVCGVFVVITLGVWFALIRPMQEINKADDLMLERKKAELAQLLPYQSRLAQLSRDVESLQKQIELQQQILPEEKQVDTFIRGIQTEAHTSGIEIRRFTAMPVATREFYSELPFEMEIDGPFFGVTGFFDRVAKMDRIVNVSGLQMANVKNAGQAKVKKTYNYAPSESVAATFVATAFFSPKNQPPAAAGPKGQTPAAAGQKK